VGIAATGFCYPGGILQIFSSTRSAILQLPTTEAVRSIQQNVSSTSAIVYIVKIFTASPSRIINFVQVDGSGTSQENQFTRSSSTISIAPSIVSAHHLQVHAEIRIWLPKLKQSDKESIRKRRGQQLEIFTSRPSSTLQDQVVREQVPERIQLIKS
jgi:hypothetical protein